MGKAAMEGMCSQIRVKSSDTEVGLWLTCHLGLLWIGGRRSGSSDEPEPEASEGSACG